MTKEEMKKLITVINHVRAAEERDHGRTATMESIVDAIDIVEQAGVTTSINRYFEEDSPYVAKYRIICDHQMTSEEREEHLVRVMNALIEYDEVENCIDNDTNTAEEEEKEEEEYW